MRFDSGSRALYATDASNYRHTPIGIVVPQSIDDLVAAIGVCHDHDAPILARGAGTSIGGQTTNTAVVLDLSRHLNHILFLDPGQKIARVEPGVVLDVLRTRAEQHGLTFGPDPATHAWCTLGGMIGNNSCGIHSIMAGKTVNNIDTLDVLTYDGLRLQVGATSDQEIERIIREGGRRGEIYSRLRSLRDRYADLIRARYPQIPRRVSGYNLDELLPESGFNVARALVGSEGTCVTVLQANLHLVDSPPGRALLVLGYPDIASGGDRVPQILAHHPIGLEGIDDRLVSNSRKKRLNVAGIERLPPGGGWLLVEFGGDTIGAAAAQAHRLMDELRAGSTPPAMRLFENAQEAHSLWAVRESALGANAHAPGEPDAWEGWEDSAVPPDRVGGYLRDLKALYDRYGYTGALYGHLGDGCIHTRINFDLRSTAGVAKFRAFIEDAADLVVGYGGSISGEHGDGQARAELLPKMFGPELIQAFREFKSIWDPQGRMNPGRVVDPLPLDQDLRLLGYHPYEVRTQFQYPDDHRDFSEALLRCVGVGKCRKLDAGVMCPSYMATGEEMHSTRGRARLLFEMLNGGTLQQGWRSEPVKEALDLCLSCKACKTECPVQVDMATYRAEFLSHYYEGHRRPLAAYLFGWIGLWAKLASRAPTLANFFSQTPFFADPIKRAVGIAPERPLPRLAPQHFTAWFRHFRSGLGSTPGGPARPQVLLWPDTFNNYFRPHTAEAATDVLEAAGFAVTLPSRQLCCGRPVYEYGMIETGRRLLGQTLTALEPQIAAATPIVILEPSCLAVFRDELPNLFPDDARAIQLRQQVFSLAEFLEQKAPSFEVPALPGTALLHGHCHQRAMGGIGPDERLLQRMGLDCQVPDSGCCGLAGAFGYEAGAHYDVSMRLGERVLFPAVQVADPDTLIVADGFSCRDQILHGSGRPALHLAEVVQMALRRRG
ncbi:MAG: FAD-binding oxidoreductase [Chloroflexi bacterium]|nr:FAD-binding oxidoreductase [Chloroflexota bacterium]